MMVLIEVNRDMNSNYENRKHGGNSMVFDIQKKLLLAFPQMGIENIFASDVYLPVGQRIEPGTLESLKECVYDLEANMVKVNGGKMKN